MTKMSLKNKLSNRYSKLRSLKRSFREDYEIFTRKKQIADLQRLKDPIFMIGIPGSLHILAISRKLLPPEVNLVLISNGMDKWEQEWARENIKSNAIVQLSNELTLPHSKVLDMLFDNYPKPFGILDYDCFVFNPDCIEAMKTLGDDKLLNTIFYQESPMLGKTPQTFFLFFNSLIVQSIRQKYKVNCGITDFSKRIPSKAAKQLLKVGIDERNYPEYGKPYFDTFRLITALAASEGFACHYIEKFRTNLGATSDIVHIGGVAHPNTTYGWWGVRGSYFWWRALESCPDDELRLRYIHKFGNRKSQDVFQRFPDYRQRTSEDFFDFVECLLT